MYRTQIYRNQVVSQAQVLEAHIQKFTIKNKNKRKKTQTYNKPHTQPFTGVLLLCSLLAELEGIVGEQFLKAKSIQLLLKAETVQ